MESRVIHIILTEQQMQNLMGLVDNGVRYAGLRAAKPVAELVDLFEAAMMIYNQSKSKAESDKNGNIDNPIA